MNRFKLAALMLFRDSKAGELTILVTALIIAVTSSTAISVFADRLQRTMTEQAAEFLAADLVITSPSPIPSNWLEKASSLNLKQSQTTDFSSVLIENDELILAGIKAVNDHYPLRGQLKVTDGQYTAEKSIRHGPKPGEAWLDQRILSALKLQIGDLLRVGKHSLKVTQLITYEPDRRADLFSLSPRVMIHSDNLAATGVLKPGSHVHYYFQFAGESTALKSFNQWIKPELNASQRIMDIHEDRPEIGTALSKAQRYLGLSSIVVVLIAGVAIAMAARRYTERHFNSTALLRCLGYKQREILLLYLSQFAILGVLASLIGCLLGWMAQQGLFYLLQTLLPNAIADPGLLAVMFGFTSGIIILLGFAIPPLLRLKDVSPLRVLRRELEPLPASSWLVYGSSLIIIGYLIWRYTEDFKMMLAILGVGVVVLVILALIIYGLLLAARKMLPHLPMTWRFGLQRLFRQPQSSVSQILGFSITLVAMIIIFSVRNDFIDNWKAQIPDNAPNHFALNIFPEEKETFQKHLEQQNITKSRLYPIVRGRLVGINNIPVKKIVTKESSGERATHRDLSLTWSETIPADNILTKGSWFSNNPGLVSVEKQIAESLHIKLGDKLNFTVGSQPLSASVASIRLVDWNNMKPNFYMIFSPGTLDDFPSTYLTSFYLASEQKNYLNKLIKVFPSISILEVDLIINQFKTILTQLTQAINYLLLFALLAGFTVLFASVYTTLDERLYEGALYRTLGAHRSFIKKSQLIEFLILGFIAGCLAVIISEAILWALYTHVIHLPYRVNIAIWFIVPIISMLTVGFSGYSGVQKVLTSSPATIMKKT
ncbi:MAG: FtsX-like permease family protein [Methylococcaceae bacterium]